MKVATVFRFGLVTALLLAATGICLAVPNTFQQGDVVSSARMNENFADLEAKLASSRVATIGTASYSIGATKACGSTATPRTGKFDPAGGSGYAAAKKACEMKCGTATAHMCSSEEVVRLAQMGAPATAGWIGTGVAATTPGPTAVVNDCYGFTTDVGVAAAPTNTQQFGTVWTGNFVGFLSCNTTNAISCCD